MANVRDGGSVAERVVTRQLSDDARRSSSAPVPVRAGNARRPSVDPWPDAGRTCSPRRPGDDRRFWKAAARLPRVSGSLPSSTSRSRSATSRARSARAMPSRSTTSTASRKPAVSTSVIARPSISTRSDTRSRVVPAISATIARSAPAKHVENTRLANIGPARDTTVAPSRIRRPRPAPASRRSSWLDHDAEAAPGLVGFDEVVALVGKIERRLEPRDQRRKARHRARRCGCVSVPSS